MKKRYLILADGAIFEGLAFGADAGCTGEAVFTTVVCNYNEVLCDPCHRGQIVVQTFPLIGNFGMVAPECNQKCHLSGYVVRECCENPSNFRCEGTLDAFLKAHNIPGIMDVDTREITRHIRTCGEMAAMICDELPADMNKITEHLKNYTCDTSVAESACAATEACPCGGEKTLALIDLGARRNIVEAMHMRGVNVHILPAGASAQDVLALSPDGVCLGDGPGDPRCHAAVDTVRALPKDMPMFGVGLGHQVIALAEGAQVEKLLHGHRGGNQPVKDAQTGRCLITRQNHGYVVLPEGVQGEIRFANANDATCEGVAYAARPALTVQFLPETDSPIYDEMTAMLKTTEV